MIEADVILFITVYAKNRKENLNEADKAEIRKIVQSFKLTQ